MSERIKCDYCGRIVKQEALSIHIFDKVKVTFCSKQICKKCYRMIDSITVVKWKDELGAQ